MERRTRRFGLADMLILIAALGAGMYGARELWRMLDEKPGSYSGRLHHKSCSEQHFFEVAFVPAGREPFVLHPDLLGRLVLQQAQAPCGGGC